MENLTTTNTLLAIMAAVSVLEALVLVGVGVGLWMAYRQVTMLVAGLEQRHVAPMMTRVNAILDDVKAVSNTVKAETERVDHAIHKTMGRVEDTAQRLQTSVRTKTNRVVGVWFGVRKAIEYFVQARYKEAPHRA